MKLHPRDLRKTERFQKLQLQIKNLMRQVDDALNEIDEMTIDKYCPVVMMSGDISFSPVDGEFLHSNNTLFVSTESFEE